MDYWEKLDIENKSTEILRDASTVSKKHLIGQPYLMAYQIALEFSIRYPKETARIGLPVSWARSKKEDSLTQYLARELSRRIKAKRLTERITHIEGGFLSDLHLSDITFRITGQKGRIHSLLTNKDFSQSMFRLKK
jgi:hypothetical protein